MTTHKQIARNENGYTVDVTNPKEPTIYIDRSKVDVVRDTAQSDEGFEVIRLVPKAREKE